MSGAEIFLNGDTRSVFVAEDHEIAAGYVRARGRFRRRSGTADAPTFSWGETCDRCWPWHRIHEVRLTDEAPE